MNNCKFITNCSNLINWQEIIDSLTGPGLFQGPPDDWKNKKDSDGNNYYDGLYKIWVDASMNTDSVKLYNFMPGKDYDDNVTKIMEGILNLTCTESWISKINPGCIAPYHWDRHLDLKPTSKRFICHISEPQFGHVFMVENNFFYDNEVGDIHEFPNVLSVHAGANVGLKPKFLYHFLGY
jgi:hypothetical protein